MADEFANVARATDVDLAGGEECRDADIDEQATFDFAGHEAGDGVAFGFFREQFFPSADAVGFALGEFDHVGGRFDVFEEDFDFVTGGREVFAEFFDGDGAFGFQAHLDDDIATDDGDHAAFENCTDLVFGRFAECGGESVAAGITEGLGKLGFDFVGRNIKGLDQIKINHCVSFSCEVNGSCACAIPRRVGGAQSRPFSPAGGLAGPSSREHSIANRSASHSNHSLCSL